MNHFKNLIAFVLFTAIFIGCSEKTTEKLRVDPKFSNYVSAYTSGVITKDSKIKDMKQEVDRLSSEVDETIKSDGNQYSSKAMELRAKQRSIEHDIRRMDLQESIIKRKISAPQCIPDGELKEFELSNIIRLGLAKVEYETNVGSHSIDIPTPQPYEEFVTVDFDVDVETDKSIILTELGELFIEACSKKNT